MKFNELALKKELIQTLDELGFEEPSPIQQQAIPVALEGKDVIGQAQTGTGKTAAFGLPILNKLDQGSRNIQALVVAPTRELAIQVQEELYRLGKGVRARTFTVFGGSPIGKQIERIKRNNPQIIVGTPGRILDLLNRRVLNFSNLESLVLDEADEMLNMGFIDDIKAIIQKTPESRQTLLFSATMPRQIKELGQQFLKNPVTVRIEAKQMTADLIEQFFVKSRDDEKFDILTRFIDVHNPEQAIIFCRTKKRVDEVGRGLSLRGYNAEVIHGDITQQKRSSVINEFRKGNLEILVATDVAARGLDISGITHVYNYDITQDPESYVHRIGRTGRAGAEGMSLTFVTGNEMAYLRSIETLTKIQMKPLAPPSLKEVEVGQVQQLIDQINTKIENKTNYKHVNTAKTLLEHYDATNLVAALLEEIINDTSNIEVKISPQKPLPGAKPKYNKSQSNRSGKSRGGNRGKNYKSNDRNNKRKDYKGKSNQGRRSQKGQFQIKKNK